MGRISIGRGGAQAGDTPRLRLVAADREEAERALAPAVTDASPVMSPGMSEIHSDPALVHHRLAALERLQALRAQGVLSDAEFAREKGLVLRMPAEELMLDRANTAPDTARPSLLGQIFGWRLLVFGLIAGGALSYVVQPEATMSLLQDIARLAG